MYKFFARQPFWLNLLAALLLLFFLGFLFFLSLSWFTNHGKYLKVPTVKGRNVSEAIRILESRGFDVVIQDSVYYDSVKRYTVIKQLPDPDATVKANRTVFLTINRAIPPAIQMPKLEGLSLRFAINLLDKNHLKLGDTIYRPDYMKGSVLEQQYNGVRITAGTQIPWGSGITLIIGAGVQNEQMLVPNLVGLTFSEAKAILDVKGITLASVVALSTVRDTATAFVYKQNPVPLNDDKLPQYIHPGQIMDLWLSPVQLDTDSSKNNKPELP